MTKNIRFYCREGKWFCDIPEYIASGGTEEDLQMVSGADIWLGMISNYKDNIILKISDSEILNEKLNIYEEDEYGATYIAHTYKDMDINHILWLCSVTHWLFGNYPQIIYYELYNN